MKRRWTKDTIENLARAHFEYIDGTLDGDGMWDRLTDDTRAFFIERMRWAVEKADA